MMVYGGSVIMCDSRPFQNGDLSIPMLYEQRVAVLSLSI